MGKYVAGEVVKLMLKRSLLVLGSKVLILGPFKENCPDIRNTRAIDVYEELKSYNVNVDVYDSWADSSEVKREFGITTIPNLGNKKYHSVILCVAHRQFQHIDINSLLLENGLIYDIKGVLPFDKNLYRL